MSLMKFMSLGYGNQLGNQDRNSLVGGRALNCTNEREISQVNGNSLPKESSAISEPIRIDLHWPNQIDDVGCV